MPLPSSIRTATYHFGGGSLRLQATFENMEKLKAATGRDPFEYIFEAIDLNDGSNMMEKVRTLFLCLQADTEPYTEAQIHEWLFGSFSKFFDGDNMVHLAVTMGTILGEDLKVKMPEAPEDHSDTAPKK